MKLQPRTQIAILIGFCLVLYFVNLNQWDLWNPDEPRYGQVSREIVNGGDWILMHNNGKMYTDKPPLFFWLIAFSSSLFHGFSSFAVRFPSALFGTLTVLLAFLYGRSLYGPGAGFLSGLVLATSFEFAYLATRANIDMTLAFFTTASLFCFFQWHRQISSGREKDGGRKTLSIYGFYVGMALATVTKGPVGFILPLLVVLIYLAVQQDWKGMKKMRLLTGMLLFLVLVLAWYIPAVLKGGEVYLNETLLKHSLNRYAGGWSHVRPFYYYFYNFPVQFLPWTLFLPGAVIYGFSRKTLEERRAFLFPFVWFAVIFVFFSLSKGKRELYILPLYPAASLMVGKFLDDFLARITSPFTHKRWITIPLYGWTAVMLLSGAAALVVPLGVPHLPLRKIPMDLVAELAAKIPLLGILLVGGSLALFFLSQSKKYLAAFLLIVGVAGAGFFYTLRVVFPLINPYKSGRYISQEITSRIQPGEKVIIFGDFGSGPYNFYAGIVPIPETEKKEELLTFLTSSERVFCLMKVRSFKALQAMEPKPPFQFIAQRRMGNDEIVLISNL